MSSSSSSSSLLLLIPSCSVWVVCVGGCCVSPMRVGVRRERKGGWMSEEKKKLWVQGFVTAWNHARLVIPPLYLVSEKHHILNQEVDLEIALQVITPSSRFLERSVSWQRPAGTQSRESQTMTTIVRNMNAFPLPRCELRFPWTGGSPRPSSWRRRRASGSRYCAGWRRRRRMGGRVGTPRRHASRHRPNLEGTHPSPPPRAGVTDGGTCCPGGRPLLS